jgi:hypothetical protein
VHILGSMIRLGPTDVRIPIPWWHRAPLGLETGTHVYVCVTEQRTNRPGDLLVSVLNPNCWEHHLSIGCRRPEEPGVVETVLRQVKKWNIALAETVTVNGGQQHQVDLIIEAIQQGRKFRAPNVQQIEGAMDVAGIKHEIRPRFEKLDTQIAFTRRGRVDHGWIVSPQEDGTNYGTRSWRHVIRKQMANLGAKEFDDGKLVLSCDTSGRLLRGMVPRKGSVIVEIHHADEPGVLLELTAALRAQGVNLLSCLLKRGGANVGNAVLVAVCEPPEQAKSQIEFEASIRASIESVDQRFEAALSRLSDGLSPTRVVYCNHPEDTVVHVPEQIRDRVISRRRGLDRRRPSIFFSRRFLRGEKPRKYAEAVRTVLKQLNCQVVEAKVEPSSMRTSMDEVASAMWTSEAGLVLAVKSDRETELSFSLSVAHEFGFLHGQGKPLLLLIEKDSKVQNELNEWSNLKGIQAGVFDPEASESDNQDESIRGLVANWIREAFPEHLSQLERNDIEDGAWLPTS